MDEKQFKDRTKKLALSVIDLVEKLPRSRAADVIGRQLIRSSTSIGANHRAACRGRSTADVIAKLSIVEEEADESMYWMELLIQSKLIPAVELSRLLKETDEIVAMTVSSIKTLRKRNSRPQQSPKSKIANPKL